MPIAQPSCFIAFQSCMAQAASALAADEAQSALSEIQTLPDWRSPALRPQSLQDLAHGERSLACWFNPALGLSVCRILGIDPRVAYQREVRSERLLPANVINGEVRKIDVKDQAAMTQALLDMMRDQGTTILSGIFHVVSQHLYVGSSTLSHVDIAQSCKIWEESEYTRISFGVRKGILYGAWPVAHSSEALGARKMIERLLSKLFAGIPL